MEERTRLGACEDGPCGEGSDREVGGGSTLSHDGGDSSGGIDPRHGPEGPRVVKVFLVFLDIIEPSS